MYSSRAAEATLSPDSEGFAAGGGCLGVPIKHPRSAVEQLPDGWEDLHRAIH